MAYFVLFSGWLLFGALHSILAAEKVKAFFEASMGGSFKYYRLIYSVSAILTLGAVLGYQFSIPAHFLKVSASIKYFIAVPCGILGAVLMGVCIRKYFYKLSGIQVLYHQPDRPVLETGGVHKYVRHPLYAGTLVVLWSVFCWFPSLANLMACVMITVYVPIGIVFEERKLEKVFGSEYINYKKNTPMLLPYNKDGK